MSGSDPRSEETEVEEGSSAVDDSPSAVGDSPSAVDDDPPVEFEYDGLPPEERSVSGTAAFLGALNVRRNATAGLLVGVLVAAAVFFVFALQPETSRPAVGYLALAFVLAVSLGGLLATVFTVGSAIRLARSE